MASIGHVEVEVRPTVTLESAEACVMMLNLFLDSNEEYRLEVGDDGKWHLCQLRAAFNVRPLTNMEFTDDEKEILANMPALRNLARMAGLEDE